MIGAAFRNWKYYFYLVLVSICILVVDFYIVNDAGKISTAKKFFEGCHYDYIALSKLPCDNAFVYNAVSAYGNKVDDGNFSGYIKADVLGVIGNNYDEVGFFHPDRPFSEMPENTAFVSHSLLKKDVKIGQTIFLFNEEGNYPVTVIGVIADTFGLEKLDTGNEKGVIIYRADIQKKDVKHIAFDTYETDMIYNKVLLSRSSVLKQLNRKIAYIAVATSAVIIFAFVLFIILLGSFLQADRFLLRNGVNPLKVVGVRLLVVVLQDAPLFIPVFIFNLIKGGSLALVAMELFLFLIVKVCLFGMNIFVRRRHG